MNEQQQTLAERSFTCAGCGHAPHGPLCPHGIAPCGCTGWPENDIVCQHGSAADIHCCPCRRSGFFPPDDCECFQVIGSGYEAGFDAGYDKGYGDGLDESSSDPRVERIEAGFDSLRAATNGEFSREDMIVMDALQAGRDFAVRLARREQHIQQMIEERASLEREHAAELIELIREKEQALSTERARQQGLKTALVDLVEDLEARWDMNDSHTNPGIRHCVEQARKALRCADETGVSPMTTPPADPLPPDVEQTLRAQASDIAFDEDDFTDYVWNGFDNPVENGELQKQIELYGQRCYRLALASMTGRC